MFPLAHYNVHRIHLNQGGTYTITGESTTTTARFLVEKDCTIVLDNMNLRSQMTYMDDDSSVFYNGNGKQSIFEIAQGVQVTFQLIGKKEVDLGPVQYDNTLGATVNLPLAIMMRSGSKVTFTGDGVLELKGMIGPELNAANPAILVMNSGTVSVLSLGNRNFVNNGDYEPADKLKLDFNGGSLTLLDVGEKNVLYPAFPRVTGDCCPVKIKTKSYSEFIWMRCKNGRFERVYALLRSGDESCVYRWYGNSQGQVKDTYDIIEADGTWKQFTINATFSNNKQKEATITTPSSSVTGKLTLSGEACGSTALTFTYSDNPAMPDIYEVRTQQDLEYISGYVQTHGQNCLQNKTIQIMNDIDLDADFKGVQLGKKQSRLKVDGGGHTIRNLRTALFGGPDKDYHGYWTIQNLHLQGEIIINEGAAYIGALASQLYWSTIDGCSFEGSIKFNCTWTSSVNGLGGLVGNMQGRNGNTCTIRNSYVKLESVSAVNSYNYVSSCGGLAGKTYYTNLENCYAVIGSVSGILDRDKSIDNTERKMGGIYGLNEEGSKTGETAVTISGTLANRNDEVEYIDGKLTITTRPISGGAVKPAEDEVITAEEDTSDKPGADTITTTKTTIKNATTETTRNEQGQEVSKTTASVSKDLGDKLLDQAVERKSDRIEITVTSNDKKDGNAGSTGSTDSVKTTEVELLKETIDAIAKDTNADLVIKTDSGQAILDNKTLETAAGEAKGDTVTITVNENAQLKEAQKPAEKMVGENGILYELTAKIGEKILHHFEGGKAHVALPMPEKRKGKDVLVIYIDDNGVCEILNHSIEKLDGDEYIRFTTTCFSTFAVVEKDAAYVKELMQKAKFKVSTTRTGKKNVKVQITAKTNKTLISDIKAMGYTVKY